MFLGTWEMCEGRNFTAKFIIDVNLVGPKKLNHSTITGIGMEFESGSSKHRKSSAHTAQVIRFATSFMPWSCRIPISEEFREFL